MSKHNASSDSVSKGIVLISAAVFLLSLADAAVKYFSARLPLWQLFLLVSCLSVPALGVWLGRRIRSGRQGVASVYWVTVRSILLLLMWVTYYAALPLIPLSVAAVAIYTTPLFIALFSTLYGGEPLSLRGWVAIGSSSTPLPPRLIKSRPRNLSARLITPTWFLPVFGGTWCSTRSRIFLHGQEWR